MSKKSKIYNGISESLKSTLLATDGWLVGKAPEQIINGEKVSDYDVIVPDRTKFQHIIKLLSCTSTEQTINSYGGFKFKTDTITLDIWCEELSHFILTAKHIGYLYNHRRSVLLENL